MSDLQVLNSLSHITSSWQNCLKDVPVMDSVFSFVEMHPLLSILGMTGIIIILRLFGIGKKLITLGAILVMVGGSIYIAKTMG